MDKAEHAGHRVRLRQRFMTFGVESMPDKSMLELMLTYALPRVDVAPVVEELLDRYHSLPEVLSAPLEELMTVRGVGEAGALLLKSCENCARRLNERRAREVILNNTDQAAHYILPYFAGASREKVYLLSMDLKRKVISCVPACDGDVGSTSFSVRKMVCRAIQEGAEFCILAHNHPFGVALPSVTDISSTLALRQALLGVNISLVDHLVVADGECTSMLAQGYL